MRVIAGSARRLLLTTPRGTNTRPTGDKIKETLFNIIAPDLYGVNFLDLFAGSGGIGIEALSRGAKHATFIDNSKEAVSCIRKNLETTHFTDKADVCHADVLSSLYNLHPSGGYDIVFMDPPYKLGFEDKVLRILSGCDCVHDDTIYIIEADIENDLSNAEHLGFEITRIKEYKSNKHVFLKRRTYDGR